MALFTDSITIVRYDDESQMYKAEYLTGVQWSEKYEKENTTGKISIARYIEITIPGRNLQISIPFPNEENAAIFYGSLQDLPTDIKGNRLSDFMQRYPKSGRVKTVNYNDGPLRLLANVKIIIG